jgi:hypothetical protein
MPRHALAWTVLAMPAVAIAACSGGGASSGDTGSFAERLALIPASAVDAGTGDGEIGEVDGGSVVMISMADIDRAADAAGIERPGDTTDEDAVFEYLQLMSGHSIDGDEPPVATLFPSPAELAHLAPDRLPEFIDEVGWSVIDVSWFVEQSQPPQVFTVMGGDFDEDRLTNAMGSPEGDLWRLGGEDHEFDPENATPPVLWVWLRPWLSTTGTSS